MTRALIISFGLCLFATTAIAQAPIEKPQQKEAAGATTVAPPTKTKVQNQTDDSKRDELTKKLEQRKHEIKAQQVERSKITRTPEITTQAPAVTSTPKKQ